MATMNLCLLGLLFVLQFSHGGQSLLSSKIYKNVIKPKIHEIIDRNIINTKCSTDLKMFFKDLYKMKLWAVKMVDAGGKLHPGILNGNIYQLGSYDECLDITHQTKHNTIQGQYCTVLISPNKGLTQNIVSYFKIPEIINKMGISRNGTASFPHFNIRQGVTGICIPKSCHIEHLSALWNFIETSLELPFHVSFMHDLCNYKGKALQPYDVDPYIFLFFGLVFALVLASTWYDLYLRKCKQPSNLLTIFSLYTNATKLLSAHCENDNITCLYGIRSISIIWIVLGHMISVKGFAPNTNSIYIILEWIYDWKTNFVFASFYSVDTFFTISGFLVIYVHLKYSEKYKINVIYFYIHRCLRLMPALFATILLYIGVLKHLSEGPAWPMIAAKLGNSCSYTWWATMLFLTSKVPSMLMCVDQTWYLTIDTCLYFMSPLMLYNFKKTPKTVIVCTILACFGCYSYTFYIVSTKNITCGRFLEDAKNCGYYVYFSTAARAPCWIVGALFGLFLYKNNAKPANCVKINIMLAATISFLLYLILNFSGFNNSQSNMLFSAFYNTFTRSLWSIGICGLIYGCSMNRQGIVNKFLSHPLFIIIGKMSYSIYLMHLAVLLAVVGTQRQMRYFSNFQLFLDFWGIFALTITASSILCVCFETPIYRLLKILDEYAEAIANENQTPKKQDPRWDLWVLSHFMAEANVIDKSKNK